MKKCSNECTPCCDFCIHAYHEYYEDEKPGPILFEAIELKIKLCSHHSDLPVSLEALFHLVQKQKEPSDRLIGRWEIVNKVNSGKLS